MIRYTVVWDSVVESRFLDHWLRGDSETRSILSAAANWIDKTLTVDADIQGRPLKDLRARVLSVPVAPPPIRISVVFSVSTEDRQARILRIVFRADQ